MSTPMITSIAPSVGPAGGGTQVSIAGSGLSTATEADDVLFGDTPAAGILSVSDSLLVVVSPPAASLGGVAVSVVTPNGTVLWENAFAYQIVVNSILPASGPVTGGTTVTITGTGLLQVLGVQFGGIAATTMTVASDTQLTATTPPAAAAGSVDVVLLGSSLQTEYIELGGFTYVAAAATTTTASNSSTSTSSTSTAGAAGTSGSTTTPGTTATSTPNTPTTSTTAAPSTASTTTAPTGTAPAAAGAAPTTPTSSTASPATAPAQAAAAPNAAAQNPGAAQSSALAQPNPGNFIPGGAMIVPGGQTGLGGSAGTGAGFGVGTLMAGGGGSAPASNLSYYVDPAITAQLVQSLIGLVQNATSPDALEAQNMILRRMALEGDVIGSRIPPPRNISEIGGYLNLLGTLKENGMREQTLAGILGVAGPAQPLGWISNDQPLSMAAVTNDRPAVAAQSSFPLTFLARSDFVSGMQSALKSLHGYGATLPLTSPSVILLPPGGTGATIPLPILFYLGRTIMIAPTAALDDPAADPVAILTPSGTFTDYLLASQVLNAATYSTAPADLEAVQCTPTDSAIVQLNQVQFVPLAPILAAAGYYSAAPFPVPANSSQTSWAWLTNTTGLVAGVTMLGDELSLLYRQDQIAGSAFAAMLTWTWNGTAFAA
ncbi:MAG: IPT/TIG domain-containing protein [Steroidobacteraceae bacterium]